MRKFALISSLWLAIAPAQVVYALGLGKIELKSALNQPLDAEIQLLSVRKGETEGMLVSLASQDAFLRAGVERPFLLTQLQFQVALKADGTPYIHVTSRKPIVEPFLNFLVEVDWPRGRLLKEYTVLLDPPVFMTDMARAGSPQAPVAAKPSSTQAAPAVPAPIVRDTQPSPVEPLPLPVEEPSSGSPLAQADQESQALPAEAESAVTSETAEESFIADTSSSPTQQPTVEETNTPPQSHTAATVGQEGEYGPVQRNESLWNIARRVKTDSETVNQMMVALLRYNPEAFYQDNINSLRQGAILRIPDEEAVLSLDVVTANEDVKAQNAVWEQLRVATAGGANVPATSTDAGAAPGINLGEQPGGQLELLAAEDGGDAESVQTAGVATNDVKQVREQLALAREELESERLQNQELRDRVSDLEAIVQNAQRMLELKEGELARLQNQLGQAATTETVEPPAALEVPQTETSEPETAMDTEATMADVSQPSEEILSTEEEISAEPLDATPAEESSTTIVESQPSVVEPQPVNPPMSLPTPGPRPKGFIDQLLSEFSSGNLLNPVLLGAAGGVAVLLFGGIFLILRKGRKDTAMEIDLDSMPDQIDMEDSGLRAAAFSDFNDQDLLDEATEATMPPQHKAPAIEVPEPAPMQAAEPEDAATVAIDDEPKDDTIAEADVYLAYGLYSQSEDLLKQALSEHPQKHEYHEKLLETYFAASNKEAFEKHAKIFQKLLGGKSSRLWDRVVAMGGELCPDNPLFSGAADLDISLAQPVKPKTADLELGSEEIAPDLDFGMGDEDAFARTGTDFDTGEVPALTDELLEATGIDDFDATQLMGNSTSLHVDDDVLNAADDDEEVSVVTGEIATVAEDHTVDLGGDMQFDLTATDLDDLGGTITDSYPAVGDVSEEADPLLTSGEHAAVANTGDHSITPTAEFDMASRLQDMKNDFEGDDAELEDEPGPDFNMGGTAELPLMEDGMDDFDLDLETIDATITESTRPSVVSQLITAVSDDMLDTTNGRNGRSARGSGKEPRLVSKVVPAISDEMLDQTLVQDASSFQGTDDLHDDSDEVETMLDLAKAYLDMGDSDSASSALEEIIAAGNSRQKQEAKTLLSKISA